MKDDLTYQIIGAAYRVHSELGAGFLEMVYENAMRIELEAVGLSVLQQQMPVGTGRDLSLLAVIIKKVGPG